MLEDVMEWQTPVQVSSIMRLVSMLWQFERWHRWDLRSPTCALWLTSQHKNRHAFYSCLRILCSLCHDW
jgi:hypothetical protein